MADKRELTKKKAFETALAHAINCESMEGGSDTPDFILAAFLADCLKAFNRAIAWRTKWYSPEGVPEHERKHGPTEMPATKASPAYEGDEALVEAAGRAAWDTARQQNGWAGLSENWAEVEEGDKQQWREVGAAVIRADRASLWAQWAKEKPAERELTDAEWMRVYEVWYASMGGHVTSLKAAIAEYKRILSEPAVDSRWGAYRAANDKLLELRGNVDRLTPEQWEGLRKLMPETK